MNGGEEKRGERRMKGGREKERKEERDPSTEKIYLIFK